MTSLRYTSSEYRVRTRKQVWLKCPCSRPMKEEPAQDSPSHCKQLESKQNTWNKYFEIGMPRQHRTAIHERREGARLKPYDAPSLSLWRQCSGCCRGEVGQPKHRPRVLPSWRVRSNLRPRIWDLWERARKRKEAGKERAPKIYTPAPLDSLWLNTDLCKFRIKLYMAG